MRSLIFLALSASIQAFECPVGYRTDNFFKDGTFYFRCLKVYDIYSKNYTRQQASVQCSLDGATLASVTTPEENAMYATTNFATYSMYIGLICSDNNNCVFDDGTPYNPSQFSGFVGGQPNTNFGNCVTMKTIGQSGGNIVGLGNWTSTSCETIQTFVCHYNPNPPITQKTGCNAFYILDSVIQPVITSPHYPEHYDNFQTCSYFLQTNVNQCYFGLNITFTDFYTEAGHDVVRIFKGGYLSNATLVGEYSGKKSSFTVLVDTFESLITFTTDGSTYSNGFSAVLDNYYKEGADC